MCKSHYILKSFWNQSWCSEGEKKNIFKSYDQIASVQTVNNNLFVELFLSSYLFCRIPSNIKQIENQDKAK